MPKHQKAIYVAVVFGELHHEADGGYSIEPQGKRDFQLTDPRVVRLIGDEGKKEFLHHAEMAYDLLVNDIKNGGMQF
jgi:hypothetical protein